MACMVGGVNDMPNAQNHPRSFTHIQGFVSIPFQYHLFLFSNSGHRYPLSPLWLPPDFRRDCRRQIYKNIMSEFKQLEDLKIPLEEIKLATNNFSAENFLARGGFGRVYKGELSWSQEHCKVAVKRLDCKSGQEKHQFLMEIALLCSCKHENLACLVGFCDEKGENLLVYKLESRGSLDKYLSSMDLTWTQRLQICIDAARGLNYLHSGAGNEHRILHRDIKSSNILLDENWRAKVSDFGLSKIGPSNQQFTFLVSNACGTMGYVDPEYINTGILTKESDVYSFGVVLFEVLCGRPACMLGCEDERRFLAPLAKLHYEQDRLYEIINPSLREQMDAVSWNMLADIAYKCLNEKRRQRPNMGEIVKDLEHILGPELLKVGGSNFRLIGTCKRSGKDWSFLLQSGHRLKKITIQHGFYIVSLIFTTEDCNGELYASEKFGVQGRDTGEITEVNLDCDEKLVRVNGIIGWGYPYVTSISFVTNKKTHGPFGQGEGTETFLLPFGKGEFAGFYGSADTVIHSIGCYIKYG